MNRTRSRRVVPRFRRSTQNVDIDDLEAQRQIDEDLKSVFVWAADVPGTPTDLLPHSFGQQNDDDGGRNERQQFLSEPTFDDQLDVQLDHDGRTAKTNFGHDDRPTNDRINLDDVAAAPHDKYFHLLTDDDRHLRRQLDLPETNSAAAARRNNFLVDEPTGQHFDLQDDVPRIGLDRRFLSDPTFLRQTIYSIDDGEKKRKSSLNDDAELKVLYDCQAKTTEIRLSLFDGLADEIDEGKIFVRGESRLVLSVHFHEDEQRFSPFASSVERQVDWPGLPSFHWTIELLHETSDSTRPRWSLRDDDDEQQQRCDYSFPSTDAPFVRLSLDEVHPCRNEFSCVADLPFDRYAIDLLSSTRLPAAHVFSFDDSLPRRQDFGVDLSFPASPWLYLQQLLTHLQRISVDEERSECFYSSPDVAPIDWTSIFAFDEQMTQRYFRKYRCKHFSIKCETNDQLDLDAADAPLDLFPADSHTIRADLDDDPSLHRDPIDNYEKFNDRDQIRFDVSKADGPTQIGSAPCLRREEFLRAPPPTWSRLRREIGFVSYNAAEENPRYKLDKSNKRFVHLPKERKNLSLNIYDGYEQFIDKVQNNPTNYFRSFDHLDLRPLLFWFVHKQHLFASPSPSPSPSTTTTTTATATEKGELLPPPNIFCRRLTLTKILANLYSDSEPWKLLVLRHKGQFYLSLANRETKQLDQMTKDEYAGYHFESLFTSAQPNSTRHKPEVPMRNPQEGFHTIQFWKFGKFRLLYSNEIDAEIHPSQLDQLDQTDEENKEKSSLTSQIDEYLSANETNVSEANIDDDQPEEKEKEKERRSGGYVEMKCTKKKIFYRDENQLQTLQWWFQLWLANVPHLMVGYKSNEGIVDQIDFLSQRQFISKFLSKFDLKLHFCLSYLYAFLELIERTVTIDDLQTIHLFAYIPQPLDATSTDEHSLPPFVPFRYTQIGRSTTRHRTFFPSFYLDFLHRSSLLDAQPKAKTLDEELKKRFSHRGRPSCPLKQQQDPVQRKKTKNKSK